jgi:uncharacterized protein
MPDQFQPALPFPWPGGAPPAFHLLAKPTGAACSLDCKYCFFLSKDRLYPDSRFRMMDEVLELYLRQLLEAHQNAVHGARRQCRPSAGGVPLP